MQLACLNQEAMFKAAVNAKIFDVESTHEGISVNGEPLVWDKVELKNGQFHVLLNHKSYLAEIVSKDLVAKIITLKVNNNLYSVSIKDKFDLLLEKMGISAGAGSKVNTIKAPMPGLIVTLKVNEGDLVKTGDALLILEAMKMENILKSPGEGVVKKVKVKKGDSVDKNQVLIEF
jgi:biotin carboxyl carrier protein